VRDVPLFSFAGFVIPPSDTFQMIATFNGSDLRVWQERDCGRLFDSADKIYRDIVSANPADLTITLTCFAIPARNTAACPAEFPPPTTLTSSPAHNWASTKVAP
jgi:hypothetical protein